MSDNLGDENEYLNDKQLSEFRARLEAGKSQLAHDIARLDEEIRGMRETHSDPLDAAQTVDAINNAIAQLNQKKVRFVEHANSLKHFDDYGYCSCGEKIGMGRLNGNITATLCIECKSKEEHINRTQRGIY